MSAIQHCIFVEVAIYQLRSRSITLFSVSNHRRGVFFMSNVVAGSLGFEIGLVRATRL